MVRYQAIAVDLDHTLLQPDGGISAANRTALAAASAAGWAVIIASGRRLDSIREISQMLALPVYVAGLNGAYVVAPNQRVLASVPLATTTAMALFDLAAGSGVNVIMNTASGTWYFPGNTALDVPEYITQAATATVVTSRVRLTELAQTHTIYKVAYNGTDQAVLHQLAQAAQALVDPVWSDANYLEMAAPGVSKLSGLTAVAQDLKLELKQFVACGDYLNDLAMLRGVGLGVAMANGLPVVQEAADVVVDNTAYDGVGRIVTKLLQKAG